MTKCIVECIQLFYSQLYETVKSKSEYKFVLRNFQDELRKITFIPKEELKQKLVNCGLNVNVVSCNLQEICISVARELFKNPVLVFDGYKKAKKDKNNIIFANLISNILLEYENTNKYLICHEVDDKNISNNHVQDKELVVQHVQQTKNYVEECNEEITCVVEESNGESSCKVQNNNKEINCENTCSQSTDSTDENTCSQSTDSTDENMMNDDETIYELIKHNPNNPSPCNDLQPTKNYDYLMSIKYNNAYTNPKSLKSYKSSTVSNSSLKNSKLYKQIAKKYMYAYK